MPADRPTEPDPPAGTLVIGVDVGGTKILAGGVDLGATKILGRDGDFGGAETLGDTVRNRGLRATPTDDVDALLDTVVDLVEEIRAAVDGEVQAVGLGIPCLIDNGRAASSVHLPIVDFDFAGAVSGRLGLPAFVENDGNLALLAEHRAGAAAGARDAVMLTLGTGIGGAVLLDGEIYRGSRGAAGELGHMVVWADGPDCGPGCPSRGCLESVASGTALVREARRLAGERPDSGLGRADAAGTEITGPVVTRLADQGDRAAIDALETVGRWLGVGLASIANIFNPELVVIGGGVIAAGELVLGPARTVLAERGLRPSAGTARVVAAHFGADSGMLGAAVFAYESINRRQFR
jgi:glucokinase